MNQLLNSGEMVQMQTTGLSCEVGAFLGGGGQGEVYRARLVDAQGAGAPVALKWFFPHYLRQDPELRTRLARAMDAGPAQRPLSLAAGTCPDRRPARFRLCHAAAAGALCRHHRSGDAPR